MPVLRLSIPRLLSLVGEDLGIDELRSHLFRLKCESEVLEDGRLEVEVNSDRPDMFSSEGIARALKGLLRRERGFRIPEVYDSGYVVYVDPPRRRPYIAVATVENVKLDEVALEELIQFQEKLHVTYGRNRRRIAIGIHDLSKVPSKELRYLDVVIDQVRFRPLHHEEVMAIRDVLRRTEQGAMYGSIALDGDKHPAIFSGGELISLPPVINADLTRLEPGTSSLLIDVTGTDRELVDRVLGLLVLNICEASRSCRIGRARVVYRWGVEHATPSLGIGVVELDPRYVNDLLGTALSPREIAEALEYMRFRTEVLGGRLIRVEVPPFRFDVLHPADLAEDVAMFVGYDELGPEEVPSPGYRQPSLEVRVERAVRDAFVGLGYHEVNTFTLAPSSVVRLVEPKGFVRIANPLSVELDSLRPSLVPTMLLVMRASQHAALPVKVFEVGDAVVPEPASPTGWRTARYVAAGLMDSVLRFEELHADVYAAIRELGLEPRGRACRKEFLIEGRTACIEAEGIELGFMGEVSPRILEELGIANPVAVAELSFDALVEAVKRRRRAR